MKNLREALIQASHAHINDPEDWGHYTFIECVREWSYQIDWDRLEKGIDLTRAERPYIQANTQGKAILDVPGLQDYDDVMDDPWDDSHDDYAIYCGDWCY